MEYITLYRRLRPKNFEEIIGQKPIIETLKNQVSLNRINHAYLFSGVRGTGKTSTAKIFAKLINCKNPVNLTPCESCESCIEIKKNRSLNVIEIDAASNNSVEDIREIIDEVKYPPTIGKFKVYIIDEVHMLSIGAFNALLKTLEEPPTHIVFILATTNPQKLPVTILSRCQRFDFKRISNKEIFDFIEKYSKLENIEIEPNAIKYITRLSDGAMRDALSILEQCISFYSNETITLKKIMDITGSVDNEIFFILTEALISFDTYACVKIVEDIFLKGKDIVQFNLDFINYLRSLLITSISQNSGKKIESVDLPEEIIEELKEQSVRININTIIKLINTFSDIQSVLKQDINNRFIFEICCIKFCTVEEIIDNDDLISKINFLERKIFSLNEKIYSFERNIENNNFNFNSKNADDLKEVKLESNINLGIQKENINSENTDNKNNNINEVNIENKEKIITNLKKIINQSNSFINRFIINKSIFKVLDNNLIYVILEDKTYIELISRDKIKIEEELEKIFNKKYKVSFVLKKDIESNTRNYFGEKRHIEEEIPNKINYDIDFE